ncbi:MAG: hypothetical protein ACREMX_02865 [Gemmatimonadales bacterium]
MRNKALAGALAGLSAGFIFGIMMQVMTAPTPEGTKVPMMAMVAQVVGSSSLLVGWLYHLFNSAVIGAIFGWLFGARAADRMGNATALGVGYGILWWVLGGLILMPLALGMPAFAPLRMPPMVPVAMGSLMGHILYGVVLGAGFVWLRGTAGRPQVHAQRHA